MRYNDGTEVREGDEVSVDSAGGKAVGVVVKILVPRTPEAVAWSAPNGGVLIKGAGLGLSLTESIEQDPEISFIRRGTAESPDQG
jgi:hypothetical protein